MSSVMRMVQMPTVSTAIWILNYIVIVQRNGYICAVIVFSMAQTTVTVDDPETVVTKKVDSNGRLYLGTDYQSKEVRVVVEIVDDEDGDEPEDELTTVNPDDPFFDAGGMFSGGEPHDTSERVDEFVAKATYEDAHGNQ